MLNIGEFEDKALKGEEVTLDQVLELCAMVRRAREDSRHLRHLVAKYKLRSLTAERKHTVADMVRTFNTKHSFPTEIALGGEEAHLQMCLIEEEFEELVDAYKANNPVEVIDAICDLVYVTVGLATKLGVDFDLAFAEVHRSNMTKPPRVGSGKVQKGEEFEPPNLEKFLPDSLRKSDSGDEV